MLSIRNPILRRNAGVLLRAGRPSTSTSTASTALLFSPGRCRNIQTLPAFSLEGKTCVVQSAGTELNDPVLQYSDIISSAARGLGKEFLTGFARSGAKGACVDLSLASAKSSVANIQEFLSTQDIPSPPDLRPYACDVTQEDQVISTFESIVRDFGHVDVLVTAAGIVDNVEAENYPYARWRKMLDVNLDGTFLWAREAGRHMLQESIRGSIILVGSMSGNICVRPQKQAAYNASKGAVIMLAKSLATEWGPHGIRVNSLSPGYMETDLILELLEKEGKDLVDSWVRDTPVGRMAHPSELQGTVVWMASDAASYLNGSDVVVDGGYTCW